MNKWDERFLRIAREVATWSKDPSTQVSAVIVLDKRILSTGYNGIPRGVRDDIEERLHPPVKYKWMQHAELNALCNINAKGTTLYSNLHPCDSCARSIIQAGVVRVVVDPEAESKPHWEESFRVAREMFDEAGVEVVDKKY